MGTSSGTSKGHEVQRSTQKSRCLSRAPPNLSEGHWAASLMRTGFFECIPVPPGSGWVRNTMRLSRSQNFSASASGLNQQTQNGLTLGQSFRWVLHLHMSATSPGFWWRWLERLTRDRSLHSHTASHVQRSWALIDESFENLMLPGASGHKPPSNYVEIRGSFLGVGYPLIPYCRVSHIFLWSVCCWTLLETGYWAGWTPGLIQSGNVCVPMEAS